MSKQTDALKLALEALEQWNTPLYKRKTAITAIREALAEQPAQQELKRIRSIISAVTGLEDDDEEYLSDAVKALDQLIEAQPAIKQDLTPEQPAQPSKPWVGLTRPEIAKLSADAQVDFCLDKQPTYEVALTRAIEAKLKEKNT